jgi:hypothetical protein
MNKTVPGKEMDEKNGGNMEILVGPISIKNNLQNTTMWYNQNGG